MKYLFHNILFYLFSELLFFQHVQPFLFTKFLDSFTYFKALLLHDYPFISWSKLKKIVLLLCTNSQNTIYFNIFFLILYFNIQFIGY